MSNKMNQMQNKNNAGLRFSQKAVWRCILGLIIVIFGIFVYFLNQVDKIELVVRTGQTFEKAEVTEILQDNLEENGTRVGEQRVRVHMLTGVRKGEDLEITSSSGYLFGAGSKVGMKVIVMQSVAGETTIASVYTQDREWVIYIFAAALSAGVVRHRRTSGYKRMHWAGVHIFLRDLRVSAYDLPEYFSFLELRYLCASSLRW